MSLKTAIKEYGLVGIIRYMFCVIKGHDYHIGQVCLFCDESRLITTRKR